MDKSEFQEARVRIDARVEAMGEGRSAEMLRVFDLLSASFANEDARPTILVHGMGNDVLVLAVNTPPLEALEIMSMAYMRMHDNVIGNTPDKGELH